MSGRLEVICGPMFSGKTEELMRRLRREQIAGRSVVVFKPKIDARYAADLVTSHNGVNMPAVVTELGFTHPGEDYDVIGIDEIQFFPELIVLTDIQWLTEGLGKKIIVTGLDQTFRREPFGVVPTLMALADRVDKLDAVCAICGTDATLTQRLVDGNPAPADGPTVLIGGLETYEARCRGCHQVS